MTDTEFLKAMIERGTRAQDGYFHYVHLVAVLLPKHLHEALKQLYHGPVWDGDVISKANRSELFTLGLALRVCCKGEQGYTGATYFGGSVSKEIEDIRTGKVGA